MPIVPLLTPPTGTWTAQSQAETRPSWVPKTIMTWSRPESEASQGLHWVRNHHQLDIVPGVMCPRMSSTVKPSLFRLWSWASGSPDPWAKAGPVQGSQLDPATPFPGPLCPSPAHPNARTQAMAFACLGHV